MILLIHNNSSEPLRINKIQVPVYDAAGAIAFRRYLDEKGRPSGVSTLSERVVPPSSAISVFNPFYSFNPEISLVRLHYEVLFEKMTEQEPNLLHFFS